MDAIQQVIQELRDSYKKGPAPLSKTTTVNTATGLVNYDLQIPSKNAYPVNTPIRKRIARVAGKGDIATRWKVVSAITGSGYNAMGWVPEGGRSGVMTITASTKYAGYTTIGEEGNLTFEAWSAAEGFEDEKARQSVRLLQKMWLKEEVSILGGNFSMHLGTPTTPTFASVNTGGGVANGTYHAQVVELTLEGYLNWIASGASIVTGVPISQTITDPTGATFVLNGGSSQVSAAAASSAITGSNVGILNASVPYANGTVAWAWYIDDGASGAKTLQAVTLINSYTTSVTPTTTGQNATAAASDHSYNDGSINAGPAAYDGLLYATFASNSGSNSNSYLSGAYVQALPTGTAGVGTKLTSSGRGTVVEIDAALLSMWNSYQTSPTVIFVNAQQLKDITTLCLNNSSGPLLQYFTSPADGYQKLLAGGNIEFYFNPFTQDGGMKIPIIIHPTLPAGTILLWCETLPPQYMDSEIPNVAEVHTRRDYYQIDWPLRTRLYESGVYSEQTVAVYAPFAMGAITNIAPGT
jgi:hypothetical protein